jgi:hypothetical protein
MRTNQPRARNNKRACPLRLAALVAVAPLLAAAAGCASFGPNSLKKERLQYNAALHMTADQQMLLNLVRLRYHESPVFLEIDSISTQYAWEATGEAGTELSEESALNLYTLAVGGKVAVQPTVTYSPLQGEDFAQRILSPLSLEHLMLLYRSGWSLKRLLTICVQSLNQVPNAARAAGPTPGRAPEYEAFRRALDLMGTLHAAGVLDIVYETLPVPGQPTRLVLQIRKEGLEHPETQELVKLLRLVPGRIHYPLVLPTIEHEEAGLQESLAVETRPLLGILYFLSHAVEVPKEDEDAGRVTTTRDGAGLPFDWSRVTGSALEIQSSSDRPSDAAVAIRARDAWFFIADSDLESKSTFSLLAQLLSLQSGKVERVAPILTLPLR